MKTFKKRPTNSVTRKTGRDRDWSERDTETEEKD